jgi:RND family efflux transporter MFP subunit
MSAWLLSLIRVSITLGVVAVGVVVGRWMWVHYELMPWTRDGRVRADIVTVAPDVAGFVVSVAVVDNQVVRRGDPLFQLDRTRYEVALRQALAAVERQRAELVYARRVARRNETLGDVVAVEAREASQARAAEAAADLEQRLADVAAAQINLQRTVVLAQVNGIVTNLELRPGDYLTAGKEGLALVDTDSLYINGYFEETKVPRIHVGDRASVRLMGESRVLYGRVHSIAGAIVDRERTPSADLVANVNPTFSWVRLAQRIPVRVHLDVPPEDVRLIAGRTATVIIHPDSADTADQPRRRPR